MKQRTAERATAKKDKKRPPKPPALPAGTMLRVPFLNPCAVAMAKEPCVYMGSVGPAHPHRTQFSASVSSQHRTSALCMVGATPRVVQHLHSVNSRLASSRLAPTHSACVALDLALCAYP